MPGFRAIEAQSTYANILETHAGFAENARSSGNIPVARPAPADRRVEPAARHLHQLVGERGKERSARVVEPGGLQLLVHRSGRRDQWRGAAGVALPHQRLAVEPGAIAD